LFLLNGSRDQEALIKGRFFKINNPDKAVRNQSLLLKAKRIKRKDQNQK
jgi:hypothetical protein